MRTHLFRTARRGLLALPVLLLLASPAAADAPKCVGPYTLNSDNFAPDATGDDVEQWVGDFTVNLVKTTGTLNVSVEAKLPGGDFASLGTMSTTSIAQFHGPLYKLRFTVSSCSSCLATIVACASRGD
jgi:hypothetical protein